MKLPPINPQVIKKAFGTVVDVVRNIFKGPRPPTGGSGAIIREQKEDISWTLREATRGLRGIFN